MDFSKLTDFFPEADTLWRVSQCGGGGQGKKVWAKVIAYIDARAIQNRLDTVCGVENWRPEYLAVQGGFLCGLSIKVGETWLTKWDGSDETDMEGFKGGISKSLVRAASAWGIGRYLYNLPECWATIVDQSVQGAEWGKTKENVQFYWIPPKLPPSFLPKPPKTAAPAAAPKPPANPLAEKPAPPLGPTKKEIAELLTIARKHFWPPEAVKIYMTRAYRVESTDKLTREQYQDLRTVVQTLKPTEAEAELIAREQGGAE